LSGLLKQKYLGLWREVLHSIRGVPVFLLQFGSHGTSILQYGVDRWDLSPLGLKEIIIHELQVMIPKERFLKVMYFFYPNINMYEHNEHLVQW
jgi:hypothetical protein